MFFSKPLDQKKQEKSIFHIKRQNFRNEIRRQYLDKYRAKIRAKLIYGDQENYQLLKQIDLRQTMNLIHQYQFPHKPVENQNKQIEMDEDRHNYDLELPQNQPLRKAVENLYLYVTSPMLKHVEVLVDQSHVFKLARVLQQKVIQMSQFIKYKSQQQNKRVDHLILSHIYEKLLTIIAHFSYMDALFFQDSYKYLFYLFSQTLHIFSSQLRVILNTFYSVMHALKYNHMLAFLLEEFRGENKQNSLLYKFQKIFKNELRNFDGQSQRSNKVFIAITTFYQELFNHIKLNDIDRQQRRILFYRFADLTSKESLSDQILISLSRCLIHIYNPQIGSIQQILIQTQQIFSNVVDLLQENVTNIRQAQHNKNQEDLANKIQINKHLFNVVGIIFEQVDYHSPYFIQITQFLTLQYEQKLQIIIQQAFAIQNQLVIGKYLQIIKTICLWGDFADLVYGNMTIIVKLFYFVNHQNIFIKKQAIIAIANILEGNLQNGNYRDAQKCQIYEMLVERFDFLQTIVIHLDQYFDYELNMELLKIIRRLCQFWIVDQQNMNRENKFWIKFVQNGGQLMLNTIVTSERPEDMKEVANYLLDCYASKEYQV